MARPLTAFQVKTAAAARAAKPFFASQPKRCAGGESGLGGDCLACGARPEQLCQAPPDQRYTASKRRTKT